MLSDKNPKIISTDEMIRLSNKYMLNLDDEETVDEKLARVGCELKDDYTWFYGEKHSQVISDRIDNMDFTFVYRLLGRVNSVEQMIFDRQRKLFKEEQQVDLMAVGAIVDAIEDGMTISEIAKELPTCFNEVVKDLNFSMMQLMINRTEVEKFKNLVLSKNELWNDKYFKVFSRNPVEQQDLLKMKIYLVNHQEEVAKKIRVLSSSKIEDKYPGLLGLDDEDFINDLLDSSDFETIVDNFDPIVQSIRERLPDVNLGAFFNDKSDVAGFVYDCGDGKKHILIRPGCDDHSIIHETGHIVNRGAFDQLMVYMQEGFGNKNRLFRRYEIVNEAIEDQTAFMIEKHREEIGRNQFFKNSPKRKYLYQEVFHLVNDWFGDHLGKLNDARMMDNPVKEFSKAIGRETFEEVAQKADMIMREIYVDHIQTKDM